MTRTLRAEPVLPARAALGEGPVWDPRTERLLWVDIPAGVVHRFDPATGTDTATGLGTTVGAAHPCGADGLVLAVRDGVAVLDAAGGTRMLADLAVPGVRGNDATVGPDGAFWVGTMAFDKTPGAGRLYRVAPDGSSTVEIDGVTISNGLAFTPDGTGLYYIDTPTLRVDRFDVREGPGRLWHRRPVVDVGTAGRPDGLALDDDGGLWVALFRGAAVHRYTPEGVLDTVVEIPTRGVTSCAFGDPDGATLYVTTSANAEPDEPVAGSLFAVRPGVTGRAARIFRPTRVPGPTRP